MKILATLFFTIVIIPGYSRLPRDDIRGSEVREITSSIHNGNEYLLQISAPAGYVNGTKKYPVVYLTDTQGAFALVKLLYGQQYFDGFIPEIIIAGVKKAVI